MELEEERNEENENLEGAVGVRVGRGRNELMRWVLVFKWVLWVSGLVGLN